uniref:Uncharacterized protein n=1 Tax=Lactuca sativa TaxID=4236 RepID=A0A9R1WSR0_LACSA|nr:hypothetical protein LSAT_V11C100041110 [Lactuca sativa]
MRGLPKTEESGWQWKRTYHNYLRCSPRTTYCYWYISYQQCLGFDLLTIGFETRQKHKFCQLHETYTVDIVSIQIRTLAGNLFLLNVYVRVVYN